MAHNFLETVQDKYLSYDIFNLKDYKCLYFIDAGEEKE